MNKNLISIIIVLLVVVVAVIIFVGKDKGQNQPIVINQPTSTLTPEVQQAVEKFKETLVVKRQYKDGRHLFLGSFKVPNVCYNYTSSVANVGEYKVIEINYLEPEIKDCPSPEEVERGFSVSFAGLENQLVKATINGEEVNLNIIEVPATSNIETY